MISVEQHTLGRAAEAGAVVAIGWYDGVHAGHRRALERVRRFADERGRVAGLVILEDDRPERRLTTVEQRLEVLAELGVVDVVWVVRASVDDWSTDAPRFIREVLLEHTKASAILTTTGGTQGDQVEAFGARLTEVASAGDFAVVPLDPALDELEEIEARCSSADVIARLDAGDVAGAAELLGRPHAMRGVVETGDQRGRTLGFPTANVPLPTSFVIPKEAVYAGTLTADDGVERPAAISLGRRPTFYPDGLELLEAHVLDFDGDLYGQEVTVRFLAHLRDQRRFSGPDELAAQLRLDVAEARRIANLRQQT